MNYQHISVLRDERVGVIKIERPQTLNALNLELMQEVVQAAVQMDKDPGVGTILLTGSDAVFAAGADIKEMSSKSFMDMYMADWFQGWDELASVRTPLIAAVSGFALGGGCELAMICDFILAADNAQFGQPEIRLGVIPGMGGSQRLTRAIGKSKAMEMILTGRTIGAEEAERIGLVARVIPHDKHWQESLATAHQIATKSLPAAMLAKEAVKASFQTTLDSGILFERRLFHSLFSTSDQNEGMQAFLEKRRPAFRHS